MEAKEESKKYYYRKFQEPYTCMIIILGDFAPEKNIDEKMKTRLMLNKNKRIATNRILKYLSIKLKFFLMKSKSKELTQCNLTQSDFNISESISSLGIDLRFKYIIN